MVRNDIFLKTGDKNDVSYYLPDKVTKKLPVIILSTWGDKELFPSVKHLCAEAVKDQIAVVSFSPFNFGETKGDDKDFTYGRWSQNLEDVYNWVTKQEWANKEKVGCFAVSSGTTTAIRYAQRKSDLAFIISVATALTTHVGMSNPPNLEYLRNVLAENSKEIPIYFGIAVSDKFYIDSILNSPIFKMKDVSCPVFFLQGGKDNLWRRSDAWAGYLRMKEKGLKTKYLEIEEGDHNLDTIPEKCANNSLLWLKEIGII